MRQLFGYGRRWWWLLLLLPLLAGGGMAGISASQEARYAATATLLINPAPAVAGGDLNAINAGQRLAATYQQLVVTEPVLLPVIARLGLPDDAEALKQKVSAVAARDTQLLRISASDTDPQAAANVANTVADQFAVFIQEQALASVSPSRSTLQGLINDTERQLTDVRAQIDELEANGDADAAKVDPLHARASQLEQSYADLLVQAQTMDLDAAAMQSRVSVAVPATVPTKPYAPRILFSAVVAAFAGIVLAIGVVGVREYLDNTVKPDAAFARHVGAPLLSTIQQASKMRPGHDQVYMATRPRSPAAEAIRLLRANLEFAAAAQEITALAVTSAGAGEGKSTVTANLGLAMAQAGFSTVIIDADLRRPSQHAIWNVANDQGLTTLLAQRNHTGQWGVAVDLGPNLTLIPSGPVPPNPAELLGLDRFRTLLNEVRQVADVIVIDSPPVLAVSDPLVIARNADAVVVIARTARTRIDALRQTLATLAQGDVRVAGVVLNQNPRQDGAASYATGYYGRTDEPGAVLGVKATPDLAPARQPLPADQ
ncbi:MAG TPA: polysaccharide biosynthesis tyrosine autokinase [Thermomicrobiales bacterium]|nr:polysaccharide biosynthesis tyrosine autokinase [Thermomicrobiales bacterium]